MKPLSAEIPIGLMSRLMGLVALGLLLPSLGRALLKITAFAVFPRPWSGAEGPRPIGGSIDDASVFVKWLLTSQGGLHWFAQIALLIVGLLLAVRLIVGQTPRVLLAKQKGERAMRDFVWFRLALILLGGTLILFGLPPLLWTASTFFSQASQAHYSTRDVVLFGGLQLLGPVLQSGMGLFLLLGSRRVTGYFARTMKGRCVACDYDFSGIAKADLCPECGTPTPPKPDAAS